MTNAIEIKNLRKTYQNGVHALEGIDLVVKKGEFFGLLGPNGAGKTTTIGVINSLVNKTSGSVSIHGIDIEENFSKAKSYLGVVPQEFNLNPFEKVEEVLINQAGFYGIPRREGKRRARKQLEIVGLLEKGDALVRQLSGGMKRRLMIARALVHDPQILILDEPTAGVDIELRRATWNLLKRLNQEGVAIILTTHYLEEAEALCKRVAIIDHGKIIKNMAVKELLTELDVETFILDCACSVNELTLKNFSFNMVDDQTIEVDVPKSQSINALFDELTSQNISINSMRNKTNRLEELFVRLTGKK